MIQEKFTDRMIGGLDGSDGATTPVHGKKSYQRANATQGR